MKDIGVVAIGRNEGERLRRCLTAIPQGQTIIYVDSGSTDGSQDFARGMGLTVVDLDPGQRFTAARARNAGLAVVRQSADVPDWDAAGPSVCTGASRPSAGA